MSKIKIACIGCGSRGRTYLSIASKMKENYEIVAAAEPSSERLEFVKALADSSDFKCFENDEAILSEEKLADLMIISTQDSQHKSSCIAAMKKGYDILVEKPIATTLEDVLEIEACAKETGCRILVCHVLRYTDFYRKVKEIINDGLVGEIVSMRLSEGVGPYHQAHSYVRGHWGVKSESSPMIIAKSCHDLDIICWLAGSECLSVSSYGNLSHFNESNAPKGAPLRCTDGCPVEDSCLYNAKRYSTDQRNWIRHVWPACGDVKDIPDKEIFDWLGQSKWGRCVYKCDNDVVDHQVVNLSFANDISVSFTMTAFDTGRNIEIYGTKGCLRGGEALKRQTGNDIVVEMHDGSDDLKFKIDVSSEGYKGHGGGDFGIINELHRELTKSNPNEMHTSLSTSISSHILGFAAEESRLTGQTINIKSFTPDRE